MSALVDTSAFLILADPDNLLHVEATGALERLRSAQVHLVTHQYVIVETVALLQRRLGLSVVRRFVDEVLPVVDAIWIDEGTHRLAVDAALGGPRRVSLTDWTSFIVMRREGITTAFAFDDDFAAQGFDVIPVPS